MKTLVLSTLAVFLAVDSPALASGCGGKKGGHRSGHFGHHVQHCNTNYGSFPYYDNYLLIGQGYEPFHCYCFVQPGDNFYNVSLREYGTSAAMQYIARYNRLSTTTPLVVGQRLMLPSIGRTGALSASRAPAPQLANQLPPEFAQPQQAPEAAIPSASVGFAKTEEAALPSIRAGSTISLDGATFGKERGSVRVKLGPVSVPATVVEWTAESVKLQLPSIDLESATPAAISVFRADGELASESQVKLTPAGTRIVQVN